ncbi:MAG: hypothetical protein AAB505_01895 [Patescibacteria group bacterium]
MIRLFLLWLLPWPLLVSAGCWGGTSPDISLDGDIDIGYPTEFHDGIVVHGEAIFDHLTVGEIEIMNWVGVTNGSILTATIYPAFPPKDGTFEVGQDVKMVVLVDGVEGTINLYCQWPDGEFTDQNGGPVFNFKFQEPFLAKVVSLPGDGILSCEVTAENGERLGIWFPVKVE